MAGKRPLLQALPLAELLPRRGIRGSEGGAKSREGLLGPFRQPPSLGRVPSRHPCSHRCTHP